MEHRENLLTAAEWHLMECLWEKSPRTGREATEYLEQQDLFVLRISNLDVIRNFRGVCDMIHMVVRDRLH